ncbi:MAG: L-rhamnose isomerase [Verrucomicrobiales bacterium]|jgi:L-rhamnose isomerase|nr:L-rhamnose isomerase [Verrucomicrobiales bacterium]
MNYYQIARERYAALGVDTETAINTLTVTPVSLHCWQGDDVGGFEAAGRELGGGLAVTGSYPGKARTIGELRQDFAKALTLIPGARRVNLHACYADLGRRKVGRDEYTVSEFQSWIDWARSLNLGVDFNPTCFSHPHADDGFTLSHADRHIRQFWINHCIACRRIGDAIGRQLGSPCVTNIWIPDGSKDSPADRLAPRLRLSAALDEIFTESLAMNRDAVESKLFGIGSESYVVGSHEFYLGYATTRQKLLCLDAGHFHPTESIADKISAVLQFVPELLLHVSRGVRWDSDHVVILDDPTKAIMEELVRGDFLPRTHLGLDFFDASINRLAAWVIGARATQQALLLALLEPNGQLRAAERAGDYTTRLALLEESKTLPFGAVWEEFCRRHDIPADHHWLDEVKAYETTVLATRQYGNSS